MLLCGSGNAQAEQPATTDELPADTVLILQRGACEHRCPVYNLIIFADGSVIFDGRAYVRRPGLTRTTIGRDVVRRLLDTAQSIGFFTLKDRYLPGGPDGCVPAASDAPTAVVTVSSQGRSQTVVHHHGCSGEASKSLAQFEAGIDAAVNSSRWVR
jgi:hypothetical protein